MELDTIDAVFSENIALYDQSVTGLRQTLSAYERKCTELIRLIASASSFEEANVYFETLYEIQGKLSGLLFGRKFKFGKKLEDLTREFDRLHDPFIREYWFKKFKDGVAWPEPS